MGYGDWIIASAQVREANQRTGQKVYLGDGKTSFLDNQIFANNPRMARGEPGVWVKNYPDHRPYILAQQGRRIIFNDAFKPEPGEIWFSDAELEWRHRNAPKETYFVVEPNVKRKFAHAVNKSWPY